MKPARISRPMQNFPHSLEAERAILGAALLDGARAVQLSAVVTSEEFYSGAHGRLWTLLQRHAAAGAPLDVLQILPLLQEDAESYGGIAYVCSLPDRIPHTENLEAYVRQLQDLSRRRRAILAGYALAEAAQDLHTPLTDSVSAHSAAVVPLQAPPGERARLSLAEAIDEERTRREAGAAALPLPWSDLERRLRVERGHLLIVAARPGMGKSAFALQLCDSFAARGLPALYICLEMPRAALGLRLVSRRGRINLGRLLDAAPLQPGEQDRYLDALDAINADPIEIVAGSGWSLARAEATIRRAVLLDPDLACVAVDYVQLLDGNDRRASRQEQTAEISKRLKALALELEILIVAVAQLSRACEQRANKRPTLSDLRESGQLEQDADAILALYRHSYYDSDSPDPAAAEALVLKSRWGETGTAALRWEGALQEFSDPDYADAYRGRYS